MKVRIHGISSTIFCQEIIPSRNIDGIHMSIYISGEDSFRPDVYGNSITITRGVTVGGSCGYKIKDSRGRIVYDKKVREELDRILD